MPHSPDLYTQWLGIQQHQRPLNHYQILGLSQFEADVEAIELAFATQKAKLVPHLKGEHVRQGKRLLMELESARNCLTQAATKTAYDDALRATVETNSPASSSMSDLHDGMLPDSLSPLDAFDPLNAQIAGLERVNSQLDQLSTAAPLPSSRKAAPPAPTMYGYAAPTPRKPQAGSTSAPLLIGAGMGAAGVLVVIAVVVFFTRGKGASVVEDVGELSVASIANAVAEDADAAKENSNGTAIPKSKSTRALMQKPVTASSLPKPSSEKSAPDKQAAPPSDAPQPSPAPVGPARVRQPTYRPQAAAAARPTGTDSDVQAPGSSATPNAAKTASQSEPRRVGVPVRTVQRGASIPSPGQNPNGVGAKPSGPTTAPPTWEKLPLAVDLPSLGDSESIQTTATLGQLDLPESQPCQLTIVYGIEGEMPAYEFKLEESTTRPHLWSVGMSAKVESNSELAKDAGQLIPIAQFKLVDGELAFQWLPDCVRVPADKLRNAVVWIQVGPMKQRIQLRKPTTPATLTLNLNEDVTNVAFSSLQGLPPLEELHLQLLEAASLTVNNSIPPSQEVQGDDSLRLVVRPGPPGIEVCAQLKIAGSKANVRVEPRIVDTDGDTMSFTTTRMNAMQRELPVEIRKAENDLANAQKRRAGIEADIAAMGNRVTSNGQANIRLAALRTSLNKAIGAERTIAERIPKLKRRLSVLPSLASVGNQIHDKAQLRFRVYFLSGGEEVDLLSM